MSLTNRDRLQRGLDALRQGLMPFVELELQWHLGEGWIEAVNERRREGHRRDLARNEDGRVVWDTSALLCVILDWWDPVFAKALNEPRGLVDGLRRTRNAWAHEEPFSADETYQALDSIKQLLEAAGAREQAGEAERHAREVLREQRIAQMRESAQKQGPQGAAPDPSAVRQQLRSAVSVLRPKVLMAVLALSGFVMVVFAVGMTALALLAAAGEDTAEGSSEDGGTGETGAAPDDLSFICDGSNDWYEEPSRLDADERQRAAAVAEELVLAVYGDPGTDPAAYERSVKDLILQDCIWGSGLGADIDTFTEIAGGGGMSSAPSGHDSPVFAREVLYSEVRDIHEGVHSDTGTPYKKANVLIIYLAQYSDGTVCGEQVEPSLVKVGNGAWKAYSNQSTPPLVEPEYRRFIPSGTVNCFSSNAA